QQRQRQGNEIFIVLAEHEERRPVPVPPALRIDMMRVDRMRDDPRLRHGAPEFEEAALHMVPAGDQAQAAIALAMHPFGGLARIAPKPATAMTASATPQSRQSAALGKASSGTRGPITKSVRSAAAAPIAPPTRPWRSAASCTGQARSASPAPIRCSNSTAPRC